MIAARTAELTEAEQNIAADVSRLRRAFDDSNVAEVAKSVFRVSENESLNDFAKRVADPDHPLSILYDVLWYASLVLGVLSLVALLLTPLFKTLPVIGADEKFMDQIRGLFGRVPRAVGAGIARVAAMTGTADQRSIPVPPEEAKVPLPDPRVDTLLTHVEQLKSDNEAHKNVFASHGRGQRRGGCRPGDGVGGGARRRCRCGGAGVACRRLHLAS